MGIFLKEVCIFEDNKELTNIWDINLDTDTYKWIVLLDNQLLISDTKNDLIEELSSYISYVRCQEKKFGQSRYFDILTLEELEEELFKLGI